MTPSHLFEPPCRPEVVRGAVPITPQDPWTDEAGQGEGHGLQEVKVGFGGYADLADAVDRAKVAASFAHGGRSLHGEPSSRVEVLGGGHRLQG